MRVHIDRPMTDRRGRGICAEKIATFAIDMGPDRSRTKTTTTIRAHILKHVCHAVATESAFIAADHGVDGSWR